MTAAAGVELVASRWAASADLAADLSARFPALAERVMERAQSLGASFAALHGMQLDEESLYVREEMVQGVWAESSLGVSVRVVVDGAWGFAAGLDLSEAGLFALVDSAVALAKGQSAWRARPVEIENLPAHRGAWTMPLVDDPFALSLEDKVETLLSINRAALGRGANYCQSQVAVVRERKWFANSFGTRVEQSRTRINPGFSVTLVEAKQGRFASFASSRPPRAAGWEHLSSWDAAGEAALAVEQAKEKMAAPSVRPGSYDLVIAPSNLWLTVHETVGHPTELDRALGYEANFAGTSFCTPDQLDRLRYGSEVVSLFADRSAEGGLATVAWDDDGVETAGKEFPIVEKGIFRNYQMALGQAALIGRAEGSNGCAYADSHDAFPIQRMPNISLRPGPDPEVTAESLIADVEDGIYVLGNGSWSIDQQRYNFQFTGQLFYRIRKGRLDGMVRDVAYQGNSVDFWNACDGLGGAPSYELGGAFNCGKGQPQQIAAVSHGAVPARFRGVRVLNTEEQAGRTVAGARSCSEARGDWA